MLPTLPGSSLKDLLANPRWLLWLGVISLPAIAQNPARVGSWPGYNRRDLHGVAVAGRYLYAAGWHGGLQIIDISNLATPVPVGGYNPNADLPYPQATADNVAVSGHHAYVVFGQSAGRRGLHVVDVSDPHTPVGRGSLYTSTACVDVTVVGGTAFVAAEATGLLIADVTNPAAPVPMGSFNTSGTARGVAVAGEFAYVADGSAGLQVIDIGNASAPVRVGGFNTGGEAYDVAIAGEHAYVADGVSGLQVIDVSDPAAPVRVGGFDTPGEAMGVIVSGRYAYIADGRAGLQIVDVGNPAAPAPVGGSAPPTREEPGVPPEELRARNVALAGNHAFVAHVNAGIDFVDVSDPLAPKSDGYHGTAQTRSVAVAGRHLYVADRYGMHVLELANPAVPRRVAGVFEKLSDVRTTHLALAFDHAYIAGGSSGITVLDVSDPLKPVFVRRYAEGRDFAEITIHGGFAYARMYDRNVTRLQILDLASPGDPVVKGEYSPGGYARGRLAFSGHLAFAGAHDGLHVIDVANPASPTRVGRIGLGSNPVIAGRLGTEHLCVGQNFPAYTSALHILDLSDPVSPGSVKQLAFSKPIIDARVSGHFVLVTLGDYGGVRVIDVSDPVLPTVQWTIQSPPNSGFSPEEIALFGEHAYLANGYAGVAVVGIPAFAPPSLGIRRSIDGLHISWPLSAASYGLEQAAALSGSPDSALWSPVMLPLETNSPHISITVPRPTGTTFYRLRKP
jgi:hypothetical protein